MYRADTTPDEANGSVRTYPKQIGIKPFPMNWGAADPKDRGPIVVSRYASTIRKRNGVFPVDIRVPCRRMLICISQLLVLTEVLTPYTTPWLWQAKSSRLTTGMEDSPSL